MAVALRVWPGADVEAAGGGVVSAGRIDAERANEAVLELLDKRGEEVGPDRQTLARLRLERSLAHRVGSASARDGQLSVEPYVRHVRHFGDPRTVFEVALTDDRLGAVELAYLAARLRGLKVAQVADHYYRGRATCRRAVKWPKFTLRQFERQALTRSLIDAGTPMQKIVNLLGTTTKYVERVAADMKAEARAREVGPVDLSTVDRETFEAILGCNPRSGTTADGQLSSKRVPGPNSRFGRLVVVGPDPDRPRHFVCRCDCGREKSIRQDKLGKTLSCGCLRREHAADMKRRSFKAIDGDGPVESADEFGREEREAAG